MRFLVSILLVLWCAEGLVYLLFPARAQLFLCVAAELPVKSIGLLYCGAGLLLNIHSSTSVLPPAVLAAGCVLFAAGLAAALLPEAHVRILLERAGNAPRWCVRLWGVLLVGSGIFLLLAAC